MGSGVRASDGAACVSTAQMVGTPASAVQPSLAIVRTISSPKRKVRRTMVAPWSTTVMSWFSP